LDKDLSTVIISYKGYKNMKVYEGFRWLIKNHLNQKDAHQEQKHGDPHNAVKAVLCKTRPRFLRFLKALGVNIDWLVGLVGHVRES
jgi:hypothetical protein